MLLNNFLICSRIETEHTQTPWEDFTCKKRAVFASLLVKNKKTQNF
jgi:hypothetical protein